jgi:hypothetical protein
VTAALLVTFGLAAAALFFVLAPLFRSVSADAESREGISDAVAELRSQREMMLAALRDLEDATMKARLSAQAIEVIDRLEAAEAAATLDVSTSGGGAVLPYRGPGRSEPPR